jgi:rhodanese-related sulfurtransferase
MVKTISSVRAYEDLSSLDSKSILIDVRTSSELSESGVCAVPNILHIEYNVNESNFIVQVLNKIRDRRKKIFLICRSGKRSHKAGLVMQDNGYLDCLNIEDGFIGNESGSGWINNKLPITVYIG